MNMPGIPSLNLSSIEKMLERGVKALERMADANERMAKAAELLLLEARQTW